MHTLFHFVCFQLLSQPYRFSPGPQQHSISWSQFCLQYSPPVLSAQNEYGATSVVRLLPANESCCSALYEHCIFNSTLTHTNNSSCNLLLLQVFSEGFQGSLEHCLLHPALLPFTCRMLAIASMQLCVYSVLSLCMKIPWPGVTSLHEHVKSHPQCSAIFKLSCSGAYFSAAGDDPSILMRAKEDYDGAEPAASSIAAANLFKLAALVSGEAGQRYGSLCPERSHHCSPVNFVFNLFDLGPTIICDVEKGRYGIVNAAADSFESSYPWLPQALVCCRHACECVVNSILQYPAYVCQYV